MKLYPAIDLKDGVCVRLLRGEMTSATSFNDDPADQALRFAAMGFEALHVVDLNGAFAGHSVNHNAVSSILDVMQAPVQLGGGIRDMNGVERWLRRRKRSLNCSVVWLPSRPQSDGVPRLPAVRR